MDGKALGGMHVMGQGEGHGITLRQHFAGMIFQQFLAGAVLPPDFDASEQLAFGASRACEAADALLAELAKEQP